MVKTALQQDRIDIAGIMANIGGSSDGAVVSFIGRARDNSGDRQVLHLEYEAYGEMARKQLQAIADDAAARWSLSSCTVVHRYGRVEIGEASIIIAASSPHRKEAFRAVEYIIDTIKERVPIWKKEFFSDGSVWVNGHT
ncbi:MAG: molybdenum cofactor biosynthesis protein MoaE [Spirochaetes bacterium]|nr:molybdenum cofactor biosynthesis protein MoaE [Spirochaetota bacterium]